MSTANTQEVVVLVRSAGGTPLRRVIRGREGDYFLIGNPDLPGFTKFHSEDVFEFSADIERAILAAKSPREVEGAWDSATRKV